MTKRKNHESDEHWMNTKWRPAMGWLYMAVCAFDFMGAPILWTLYQGYTHGNTSLQWQPLTLQGAGLFHLAMGAVLGIAAYGRTQEKLSGNGTSLGTTYVPPNQGNVMVSNQQFPQYTQYNGMQQPYSQYPNMQPIMPVQGFPTAQDPEVVTGYKGKKAPKPADEPVL